MIYKEYDNVRSVSTHTSSIYANLLELQKNALAREEESTRRGLLGNSNMYGRRFIILEHQYGRREVMWKRSKAGDLYWHLHWRAEDEPLLLQRNSEMSQSIEKWIRKSCSFI